jgi:hypothetical protein
MRRDEMMALAELICFGYHSVELGGLLAAVDRGMRSDDFLIRRDHEEISEMLNDLSWLERFLGRVMDPDLLCAVRCAFMERLLLLQAEGRISGR